MTPQHVSKTSAMARKFWICSKRAFVFSKRLWVGETEGAVALGAMAAEAVLVGVAARLTVAVEAVLVVFLAVF